MSNKIIVISDVDGCLTDGGLYYTAAGKVVKKFGVGDHEGVKLLKKNGIDVKFVTADKTGLPIVSKRIKDMSNCLLCVLSEIDRLDYIKKHKSFYDTVVFFGDGLGDANVKKHNACDIFVCPKQSRKEVQNIADYVTEQEGGRGAYLDMAIWAAKKLRGKNYKELYEED